MINCIQIDLYFSCYNILHIFKMMLVFYTILLSASLNNINTLLCSQFVYEIISPPKPQSVDIVGLNKSPLREKKRTCHLTVKVYTSPNRTIIEFGGDDENLDFLIGTVMYTTTIAFTDHNYFKNLMEIQTGSIFKYVCSNHDGCNRQFAINHVNWLLNVDYTLLSGYIHPQLQIADDILGIFKSFTAN